MTDQQTIERHLVVDGEPCRIRAKRNDKFFGHALDTELYGQDGKLLNKLSFACHPNFPGFEECQIATTDEAVDAIIRHLESGYHDAALKECRMDRLVLLLPLNGANQGL